jgi:hypothetical protein
MLLNEKATTAARIMSPGSTGASVFEPIFYSWRGSTWHKSLILLGAG